MSWCAKKPSCVGIGWEAKWYSYAVMVAQHGHLDMVVAILDMKSILQSWNRISHRAGALHVGQPASPGTQSQHTSSHKTPRLVS